MTADQINDFRELVWEYFRTNGRSMPWREHTEPYYVVVSELMLQQTQVERVIPKFNQFIVRFPDAQSLANAPLSAVLTEWVGLGYNRRAQYLHRLAQDVVNRFNGSFPPTYAQLVSLPGIGPNTAGAVLNYAFNQPAVFVETNIRTVFIHHFFADAEMVDDKDIRGLVEATLDQEHPREWFWALMDYGTYLKRTAGNNIARSRNYKKQSRFEGSLRQIRGKIVALLAQSAKSQSELERHITDPRLPVVLRQMADEKLITIGQDRVQLAE